MMKDSVMIINLMVIIGLFIMFGIEKDMTYAMMAFGLITLDVFREVALSELAGINLARIIHESNYAVRKSYFLSDAKYVHSLYQEYRHVGYSEIKAHILIQDDTKDLNIGDLYKPFTHKPTLVTRILLTKIGGKH